MKSKGSEAAQESGIPFEITPYYLSLFHKEGRCDHDRQVRAQVIPSARYCAGVVESACSGVDLDFMGEKSTSPIDGITPATPRSSFSSPTIHAPRSASTASGTGRSRPWTSGRSS